jgi:hypothetical protein
MIIQIIKNKNLSTAQKKFINNSRIKEFGIEYKKDFLKIMSQKLYGFSLRIKIKLFHLEEFVR